MLRLVGLLTIALLLTLWPVQPELAASPAQPVGPPIHIVQAGETLWSISQRHQLPLDLIARGNRLQTPDRLQIGDTLTIPVQPATKPPHSAPRAPSRQDRVHVIQAGDTVWSIAQQHRTSVDVLVRLNRLTDASRLRIGDALAIPPARTAPAPPSATAPLARGEDAHVVQPGDTLWSIAQRHGTPVQTLVRTNRLGDDTLLRPGQRILVTDIPRPSKAASASPGTASPTQRAAASLRSALAWPSRGVLTSRFGFRGKRHHHGIDIAAPVGMPISAAQDGTVQFAGWMGGYGLLAILDHGAGLTTWYGHASRLLVAVGEQVRKGQIVAKVGTTGEVTGPNVHFEVRRNNVPLDPLTFLRTVR